MTRNEHTTAFVHTLWEWYATHKRHLPWRDLAIHNDTERAYQILVSEIMLQQTQVSRVQIVFKNFLERFPTLKDLAAASNKDVILAWRGMGYNSRALRLRDAAKSIVEQQNGVFPREMQDLLSIKGIGNYTAGAIRNFAFGIPTPCIDTNIRRILHRVFIGPEQPDGTWEKSDKELMELAESCLAVAMETYEEKFQRKKEEVQRKEKNAFGTSHFVLLPSATAEWHAALMDYGSLVCTKRNPKWDICPLTQKGLMKAAYKVKVDPSAKKPKTEPGRTVGSTFIPNRIFRGRIVEELRDASACLSVDELGQRIAIDWNPEEHRAWLQSLVKKLVKDQLITKKGRGYVLQ